jgi:hypothetical protein
MLSDGLGNTIKVHVYPLRWQMLIKGTKTLVKSMDVRPKVAIVSERPLNPAERVWQAIKDHLAWRCFDDLFALQDRIAEIVDGFDPHAFRSLVAYPYLLHPDLAA